MWRRLLERLEERVPRVRGEHVRLVDDVDLAAQRRRKIADALAQLAHVVDAAIARGVDLEDVDRRARQDLEARRARVVRLAVDERFAVDRASEDSRRRCLAGAANPGKEIAVRKAARAHLVEQRLRNNLLADKVGETLRAVFAVEGEAHDSSINRRSTVGPLHMATRKWPALSQ